VKRLLVLLLLGGCSTAWDLHAPKTVAAGPEGGEVTVEHGQRLRIRLPADTEWRRVEPMIKTVIPAGPREGEYWMFTPVRSGQETLRFESAQASVTYQITVPDSPSGLFRLVWYAPRKKDASP
jgi:hypothetical protein